MAPTRRRMTHWMGALMALAALMSMALAGCDAPTLPFDSVPAQQCVAQGRGALGKDGGVIVPLTAYDPTAKYHTSGLYAVRGDGALAWSCATTTYVGWNDAQLVGGTLYAIAGTEFEKEGPTPTHVHALYAIRPTDGKQLWQYSFRAGATSALDFDGGRIFFASVTSDGANEHSNLYALSAANGALAWQESFGDTVGQPMIAGGRIYLPITDPSGPQLRALSERDGGQVWSDQLAGQDALANIVTAGDVIAYAHDDTLTALDAVTGAPRWSHAVPASVDAPLAAADGAIISAAGQSVFAFDAASGALRWSAVLDARALVQSATARVTYATTLTPDGQYGQVVALDTRSGDILWQRDLPDLATLALGGADAWLLVPVGAQKLATLVALDAQGDERWRYAGQSPYNTGALLPDGATLYYVWQGLEAGVAVNPTTITYVTCLRASDGAALWTTPLPAFNASPLPPLLVTA